MSNSVTGSSVLDSYMKPGASAATGFKKSNDTLDQTSFLRLMTTQLQTQDPFNPVDNTQMVAQMAQFSQVAGIAEMNASLKQMAAGSRIGDMASWIGRAALVESKIATPLDGVYAGQVSVGSDATSVKLSLVDVDGNTVHSEDFGAQKKGDIPFAWDSGDADLGPLKLVATATDASGAITSTTSAWTNISAVQSPAGGAAKLVTPLGLLDPAEAIRLG